MDSLSVTDASKSAFGGIRRHRQPASVSSHRDGFAELIREGLTEDYGEEGLRAIAVLTLSGDFDPGAWVEKYAPGMQNIRELYADTQPPDDRLEIEALDLEQGLRRALELSRGY